jgi:mxaL protein
MALKLLWISALLLVLAITLPALPFPSKHYNYFFIIDITRSMNVEDYETEFNAPLSRLEKVKRESLKVIQKLPCGSKVALGIFTERMPTMIHSAIEVCDGYSALRESIEHLDWRMAWVADSNIIQALYNALKLMRTVKLNNSTLVFFTDGHEAPPMNMNYAPDFLDVQSENNGHTLQPIKGIIIGTGQTGLSRIPKFDEEGSQVGFYTAEDVPHRSTFGQPDDPRKVEGYVPRNAPWGNQSIQGTEHLSSVKEVYLKTISQQAGLDYHHLQLEADLYRALTQENFTQTQVQRTNLRYIPALLAWCLLLVVFCPKRIKHKFFNVKAK